jgi:Peptidase family C50
MRACKCYHDIEDSLTFLLPVVDMINGYHALSSVQDKWDLHTMATKRFVRYILSPEVSSIFDIASSVAGQSNQPLLQLQYDVKLRDAAIVLSDDDREGSRAAAAMDCLNEIVESSSCSNLCRAWSFYLLGSLALKKARKSGDLHTLWYGARFQSHQRNSDSSLADAQSFFRQALLLLGSACDILKRNVQRCLALTTGPGTVDDVKDVDSCRLINASVGCAAQLHMLKSMQATEENEIGVDANKNESSLAKIFGALEHSPSNANVTKSTEWFFDKLGRNIPPGWRFITAALCPTGELLLTSVEYSVSGEDLIARTTCVFPETDRPSESSCEDIYDEIVKPLNEIVQRSQEQLSEGDIAADDGDTTKKEERTRQWWCKRKQVDSDLQKLLARVEQKLLSTDIVQQILLGFSRGDETLDGNYEGMELSRGNLSSRFEAASIVGDQVCKFSGTDPSSMKVAELRDELEGYGIEAKSVRKMKKAELVLLVQLERDRRSCGSQDETVREGGPLPSLQHMRESDEACTFLILDENLQRFPFEGMPCFAGRSICRLPSLPFALAKLVEADSNGQAMHSFCPERTSYILDPESNLSGTNERLLPFMDTLNEKYGSRWRSVVGDIPSVDFMEQGLSGNNGLLLYFGHGGGQQYFAREKIEDLSRRTRRALSSVILMGCSSGKLESVNTKNSISLTKLPIHYEPEGIALSYLLAGAPCVVGNLWDVTDRDIDRYAMTFLEAVFDDNGNSSIAQSVAEARAACKMRYIVGCAPVCYGLPIIRSKTHGR